MKRIVNRRFIYYLKKNDYIDHDPEHDSRPRHGTDTQFTTLNRFIWSAVGWSLDTSLFWLSQIFFMLKRKRAKAIRTLASTRPSAKHATAGERRFRGVRLYTMWSTGFRTKVAQQKSHSHIDMMSKNHRTWFAIHCSYSNDWRSMWDWGNTADD